MTADQTSLAELSVHMDYMRKTVQALHDRLDGMPTARQMAEMKDELDKLSVSVEEQRDLMRTLVALERFAKWFTAVAAGLAAVWGLVKILKGGG